SWGNSVGIMFAELMWYYTCSGTFGPFTPRPMSSGASTPLYKFGCNACSDFEVVIEVDPVHNVWRTTRYTKHTCMPVPLGTGMHSPAGEGVHLPLFAGTGTHSPASESTPLSSGVDTHSFVEDCVLVDSPPPLSASTVDECV